ncbi:MAG: ABC transporter permease [Ignavibacteriae bacterium]|nr:ABC transporter permease [Ignavibacteriota bacterium]
MTKAFAVARWEYLEKVKSKAFLIGLFLTPIIMIAMGVLPGFFASQPDDSSRTIAVLATDNVVAPVLAQRLQGSYKLQNGLPNYVVLPLIAPPAMGMRSLEAEALQRLEQGEFEGFIVLSPGDSVVEYRSKVVGDFEIRSRIRETLHGILAEQRVKDLGLDKDILRKLDVPLDVRIVKIAEEGKDGGGFEKVFISAYVFLMMLFLLIMSSGQMLVRSMIEEKSNRIVEVLVSSCSPTDLMVGKVLGLSGLGLTQMAFWAAIAVAVSSKFNMTFIEPSQAGLLILYFVLGYLFYAAVFIAAGAPFNTEQEAQQVTSYLVMFLILPIVLAIPAMKDPGAPWIKVLSFIPLLTPTMMALRIPILMPEWWEILLTTVIMVVSIYFGMIVAGRIFRIGILATGKTPGFKEILRWIRTG